MVYDPNNPIVPSWAYWDDDLDRQLAEYAAGVNATTTPAQQIAPHTPPVAPADEWNDGGGPSANAAQQAADLAAVRAGAQAAADKVLGADGGAAFADGMHRELLNAISGPSVERDINERERLRGNIENAAAATLGPSGAVSFREGMTQEQLNAISGLPVSEQARHYDPKYGWVDDKTNAKLESDRVVRAIEDTLGNVAGKGAKDVLRDALLDKEYPRQNWLKSQEPHLLAAAPRGRAYIAQATGPVGTIGQIREELPIGAIDTPLSAEEAQQIEIESPTIEMDDDYVGKSVREGLGLGEPDAISGGTMPGQDHLGPGQTSGTPQEPDEYLTPWERAQKESKLSPEEQAKIDIDLDDARRKFAAAEAQRIADNDLREANQNASDLRRVHKSVQERSARAAARAEELANTKIDPLRDIGIGTKIAGVLASFIGGFAANANGGRNVGLEAVDDLINRSIQTQTANLQNQKDMLGKERSAIADELAQGKDLYEAQETLRIATYGRLAKELETKVQNFDPMGTQAQRYRHAIAQIRARQAESLMKFQEDDFARTEKLIKEAREQQKLAADIENQREQRVHDRRQLGLGYAQLRQKDDEFNKGLALEQRKVDVEEKKIDAEAQAKKDKLSLEQGVAAPPKLVADDAGNVSVDRNTGNLKQADGSDWIIPTEAESKEWRKKKAAADDIIKNLDEIRLIRDRVGGESSWGNSDDYQRLQVLKQNIVKIAKAGTEGMSSDADMARLEKAAGAESPSSFRSQAASLEEGRRQIEQQLNTVARNLKYTGPDITYPDPLKMARPPKSPQQETVQGLLTFDPKRLKPDEIRDLREDAINPLVPLKFPPRYRKAIDDLVSVFNSTKVSQKERDEAGAHLEKLKNSATSSVVRDYATAAAASAAASSIPVGSD